MTEKAPTVSPNHRRARKTILFLAVAVLANSFGNLLLALAMDRVPGFFQVGLGRYLLDLSRDPFLLPGALLTAVYSFVQLSLFSWADLSYVVPCTASTYVISTLLARFVLGEQVDLARWIGVVLIFIGVGFVAETPVATKPHPAPDTLRSAP